MKILSINNYQVQNKNYKKSSVNKPQILFGLKNSSLEELERYSIEEIKNMLESVKQRKFYLQKRAINNYDIGVRYFVEIGIPGSPVLKYSPKTNVTNSFIKIQKPGHYNVILHEMHQKLSKIQGLKKITKLERPQELAELVELKKLYGEASQVLDELIKQAESKQI